MNYLAHAYLSFGDPGILTGNMISDFIKGKKQYDYPADIRKGIVLHRRIDEFTDSHAATAAGKQFLKTASGLYAGAFMDVVYDHFLALDPTIMTEAEWLQFTTATYRTLQSRHGSLPEQFALIFPWMQQHDWLYNYRFRWGIEKSFGGVVRRAKYLDTAAPVFRLFETHYESLKSCYDDFFPDVKKFAAAQFDVLLNDQSFYL
ncbi:acyl carrier protein phosphodiesterase [Sediminibacterium ginsengisoli]|uniref:Acyl carrier protein phosphodiesterase n=1 Tax=Sediminibacterium ginsengisoli TaxID=413434 RepID=A0A1T4JSI4_9BACT|nr:ACP phosphodiesterase [Sediminibacterium ginsengisoli]SJZ33103.1 Acyl carrier protein phosphodiesterase [Sediminibacterium ginsengisoli]